MIGRDEYARVGVVVDAGRPIRRKVRQLANFSHDAVLPLLVLLEIEGGKEVQLADLPDAVPLYVFVLIGAFGIESDLIEKGDLHDRPPVGPTEYYAKLRWYAVVSSLAVPASLMRGVIFHHPLMIELEK